MIVDVSIVMTWILFLAMFPMAFFWLRRAYRIFIKKDYSEVALKRGEPPTNPERFAPYTGAVNLLAGTAVLVAILGVLSATMPYRTWSSIAGIALWGKVFGDFIVSRHAHPIVLKWKWLQRGKRVQET